MGHVHYYEQQTFLKHHECFASSARLYEYGYKRMSRFKFLKNLGQGSYGKVDLYYDKDRKMKVAIKSIPMQIMASSNASDNKRYDRKRIDREIAYLRELDGHPNIIRLLDVFETREALWLVMEYVDSGELFDYIVKRGFLSMEESFCYFRQIVSALLACHLGSGIVHRDLKPENILLHRSSRRLDKKRAHGFDKEDPQNGDYYRVLVGDFGFSNRLTPEPLYVSQYSSRNYLNDSCAASPKRGYNIALMDTFCGSPYYASPEMIQGKPYVGPAVDIWSLGIILYAMSFGRLPFDDPSTTKLFDKISHASFECPISDVLRHRSSRKTAGPVPAESLATLELRKSEYLLLEDLLRKMLDKDAQRRISLLAILQHPWYILMLERASACGNTTKADFRARSCSTTSFQSSASGATKDSESSTKKKLSISSSFSGFLRKCSNFLFKRRKRRKCEDVC